MTGSSASAIVELSRSKQRYHDQDALLKAFIECPGYTAKEVAVEAMDWKYEQYSNSPKRAFDLECLGYLEKMSQKICRCTGKLAHSYRVTDKGLAHLRSKGIAIVRPSVPTLGASVMVESVDVKQKLSEIRGLLGD